MGVASAKGRSFLGSIRLPLSGFHRERVRLIDDFDYTKVAEKTRKELHERGIEVDREYLHGGIHALKQYCAVALLDPLNMHAVSERVDPFWHSHIIFTRDYAAFCERIYGQYIHHQPLDESNDEEVRKLRVLYRYTHGIYRQMFSHVDEFWWPQPEIARMICYHYKVTDLEVVKEALFPIDPGAERCAA